VHVVSHAPRSENTNPVLNNNRAGKFTACNEFSNAGRKKKEEEKEEVEEV